MPDTSISLTSFFGKWVVRAAFILAIFGWGVGFYGPPIFLHAVIQRTAWPLSLVSTAVTAHFLFGALSVANLPRVHRRWGVAVTTTGGATLAALGIVGWAYASSPWHLFVAALLSGSGWATMGAAGINAIISPWYALGRPGALSKAYNGASIGGLIFSPLWVFLIARVGFPATSAIVGAVMIAVVAILALLVFKKTPAQLGQLPDDNKSGIQARVPALRKADPLPGKRLWGDLRFLTLAVGMAAGLSALIGVVAHLFSLLVPIVGAQYSGMIMAVATACAVGGRALAVWVMAAISIDRRFVACAAYLVQILGCLVLMAANENQIWMILVGVMLFGAGIGNATSLPPVIAQAEFSEGDVSRVVALIVAMSQATYAFSPMIFGVVLSMSSGSELRLGESTILFFVVAGMLQALAISMLLMGRRRS